MARKLISSRLPYSRRGRRWERGRPTEHPLGVESLRTRSSTLPAGSAGSRSTGLEREAAFHDQKRRSAKFDEKVKGELDFPEPGLGHSDVFFSVPEPTIAHGFASGDHTAVEILI